MLTGQVARCDTYNSKSVSRDESRNPFANGFESIFSFVICLRESRLLVAGSAERQLVSIGYLRYGFGRPSQL